MFHRSHRQGLPVNRIYIDCLQTCNCALTKFTDRTLDDTLSRPNLATDGFILVGFQTVLTMNMLVELDFHVVCEISVTYDIQTLNMFYYALKLM